MRTTKWLIWSHEHKAWWGPDRCGYVFLRANAGRYSFRDACEIVEQANAFGDGAPNEAMVREVPGFDKPF